MAQSKLMQAQNPVGSPAGGGALDGPVLATVTRSLPDGAQETVSVIEAKGEKYPLIRVVDKKTKPNAANPPARTKMVADHVMVRLQPGITADMVGANLPEIAGLRVRAIIGKQGHALLKFANADTDPDALPKAMAVLNSRPDLVKYAEPDFIVTIDATPNDPKFTDGSLWGMLNTGQSGGTNDADIDAPEGWDARTDAESIIVAVVDTGIRTTHEDLAANLWINTKEIAGNGIDDDGNDYIDDVHGINAITDSGDPTDDNRHGTHCAGTIGGVGNNGKGVAGVAWKVKLLAAKFLSGEGSGAGSDAVKCLQYAADQGARVISNSWGGGAPSQAVLDAIEYARDRNAVVVIAAGNSGQNNDTSPTYPSSYRVENIVSVAATTRTETLASYSNYGKTAVNVGAPGSDIVSCLNSSDTAYGSLSGTSMATPHVSGVLAVLAAQFPTDDYGQLINRLYRSVDPVAALATRTQTGGRVNLQKALATTTNRPLNDDFASALTLTADTLRTANLSATVESNEPAHDSVQPTSTIWYRWTSTNSTPTILSTLGSSIDTTIAVYSGTSLEDLSLVAANDDIPTGTSSRLRINPVVGTTYYLSVGSKNTTQGLIMLSVGFAPPNDYFADATVISGSSFSVAGTTINGSNDVGEPPLVGEQSAATVWYSWTAPSSGGFVVTTQGGTNFDTLLGVYTGDTLASLQLVGENDNITSEVFTSRVLANVTAGTTYRIVVGGKSGASGNFRLTIGQPPINDKFADAITMSGALPISVTGNNRAASIEEGEPVIVAGGQPGGTSVWWKWTAPQSLDYAMDTFGSDYDTMLAVYRGTSVDQLTLVASNDDSGFNFYQSRVAMAAVAGVTYYIRVDGYYANSGNIRLTISNAARGWGNDYLADAVVLDGHDVTATGSNVGAVAEWPDGGEMFLPDNGAPFAAHNAVWWSWTAPASGAVNLNFFNYEQPYHYVEVLRMTDQTMPVAHTNLSRHAYATQISYSSNNNLNFSVTRGTRYFIRIGYRDSQTNIGQFSFRIRYTDLTNQPPRITNATLNASGGIDSNTSLGISNLAATDPEADPITYSYQWQRSADLRTWSDVSGAATSTITPQAGYFWRARIRPSDATADGVWFPTEAIAVDAPPALTATRGQTYSYTSGLALPSPHPLPRLPAFVNEFSKGPAGATGRRWIEILTQQQVDLRGLVLLALPSNGASVTFSNNVMWANVPAGSLIIVYNGANRDSALPPDALTPTNGVYVVSDLNTTAIASTNGNEFWVNQMGDGDPNVFMGGRGMVLRNSRRSMFFRMGWGGDGGVGTNLPNFPTKFTNGQSLRYIAGATDTVEMQSSWEYATGNAADVSPGRPNSLANQEYVDRLRAGALPPQFRLVTPVPPGLAFSATTGTLSGSPTAAAGTVYPVTIERFNGYDSALRTFNLTIQASALEAFRTTHNLAADGSQDLLAPAGDSVANLLKYAFNMIGLATGQASALTTPNTTVLSQAGNAGLPAVINSDGKLQVTYIRRKVSTAPSISYAVEFTDTMETWQQNPLATENVTSIDATFERVTVTDSVSTPGKRFARVRVSSP
jgi:subtilisin family serine protease